MSAKPAFEPALRAFAARERRALDDHPTPEILVAYRAGELTAGEEEKLRDHLALCPDCAEMLLDLVTFEEFTPPKESPGLTDAEIDAAWHRVQPRLAEGGQERPADLASWRDRRSASRTLAARSSVYDPVVWRRKLRNAYAVAAVLFVGAVGLTFWGLSLQRKLRADLQPTPNVALIDLNSETLRSSSNKPDASVPAWSQRFVLLLHLNEMESGEFPEYMVELRPAAQSAKTQLRISGLKYLEDGITLELSRDRVPPGSYQLDLFGLKGGDRQLLASFALGVAPP